MRIVRTASLSPVLGFLLPLSACGQVTPDDPPAEVAADARAAIESITAGSVREHIEFLASDAMAGRDTPSEELERAAEYLSAVHRDNGVEPGMGDGTFLQRFPLRLLGANPSAAEVVVRGSGGDAAPTIGRDAFTDGGSDAPIEGGLTFVRARAGVEVDPGTLGGRVALFRLPGTWGESLWFEGLDQSALARDAGAAASLHVLDAGFPASVMGQLQSVLAEPGWRVGDDGIFPRVFVREGVVRDAGIPLPWESPDPAWEDLDFVQVPLEASMATRTPVEIRVDANPPNVVARVPGRDPALRDEYIVLTAHFDHVGVGTPVAGDSIYNGADDNASGTGALLEIARVLAALPEGVGPGRSVLFVHVSAEEKGLLGSQWWVDNPTVPLDRVVANINMDMVSGDTHPDTIAVLGQEYSSLGTTIAAVNGAHPEIGITTVPDLWPQEGLFYRSDQLNFMRAEIPALFLFAGFHDCYHRPCDEVDFVNPDKAARVARLVAYTILEIANRSDRPTWDPDGLAEVRSMTSGGP